MQCLQTAQKETFSRHCRGLFKESYSQNVRCVVKQNMKASEGGWAATQLHPDSVNILLSASQQPLWETSLLLLLSLPTEKGSEKKVKWWSNESKRTTLPPVHWWSMPFKKQTPISVYQTGYEITQLNLAPGCVWCHHGDHMTALFSQGNAYFRVAAGHPKPTCAARLWVVSELRAKHGAGECNRGWVRRWRTDSSGLFSLAEGPSVHLQLKQHCFGAACLLTHLHTNTHASWCSHFNRTHSESSQEINFQRQPVQH